MFARVRRLSLFWQFSITAGRVWWTVEWSREDVSSDIECNWTCRWVTELWRVKKRTSWHRDHRVISPSHWLFYVLHSHMRTNRWSWQVIIRIILRSTSRKFELFQKIDSPFARLIDSLGQILYFWRDHDFSSPPVIELNAISMDNLRRHAVSVPLHWCGRIHGKNNVNSTILCSSLLASTTSGQWEIVGGTLVYPYMSIMCIRDSLFDLRRLTISFSTKPTNAVRSISMGLPLRS